MLMGEGVQGAIALLLEITLFLYNTLFLQEKGGRFTN